MTNRVDLDELVDWILYEKSYTKHDLRTKLTKHSEQVELELLQSLNVGKIKNAEGASNMTRARTKRGAFLEGFRYARNNLQHQKADRLAALQAQTGDSE